MYSKIVHTVREFLVQLLFSDGPRTAELCKRVSLAGMWPGVIRTAAAWSVVPVLNQRVTACGCEIGPEASALLRKVAAANFARSGFVAQGGVAALGALEAGGLAAAAFKGCAAMASLYRSPQQRTIRDVDILVRPEDLEAALRRLEEAGFRTATPTEVREVIPFARHSPAFAGNLSVPLRSPDGREVDLHWRIGIARRGLSTGELIGRARRAELFGATIPVTAPGDCMVLTAHHAFRENLSPDAAMRDLLDVEAWCGALAARGELRTELERAVALGSLVPLLAMTGIAVAYRPDSPAWEGMEALDALAGARERKTAARLTALFKEQVRAGALNRDLSYLAHPRSLREIAAGVLGGWKRHSAQMRKLEEKNDGRALPLGARLRGLGQSLAELTPARARMIRALARVKEDYRERAEP
jgi:hypothetical protein